MAILVKFFESLIAVKILEKSQFWSKFSKNSRFWSTFAKILDLRQNLLNKSWFC